jgi:hypothetical protein
MFTKLSTLRRLEDASCLADCSPETARATLQLAFDTVLRVPLAGCEITETSEGCRIRAGAAVWVIYYCALSMQDGLYTFAPRLAHLFLKGDDQVRWIIAKTALAWSYKDALPPLPSQASFAAIRQLPRVLGAFAMAAPIQREDLLGILLAHREHALSVATQLTLAEAHKAPLAVLLDPGEPWALRNVVARTFHLQHAPEPRAPPTRVKPARWPEPSRPDPGYDNSAASMLLKALMALEQTEDVCPYAFNAKDEEFWLVDSVSGAWLVLA